MIEAAIQRLHVARRHRRQAARARSVARSSASMGAAANERLRLFAARLESAAQHIERRVVASRPRSGQDTLV